VLHDFGDGKSCLGAGILAHPFLPYPDSYRGPKIGTKAESWAQKRGTIVKQPDPLSDSSPQISQPWMRLHCSKRFLAKAVISCISGEGSRLVLQIPNSA
jgi:hypothetical protein